jgi:phage shock protein PspC (stress-responsive transcriptional regulator)
MTATGFGLLISLLLKQIHSSVALTAGEVLEDIWEPAFVALVLSFVTAGVARRFGLNVLVARVATVVGVLVLTPLLYLPLWVLMPSDAPAGSATPS